jgi:uncharacterized RDD family membrane protein YckC
MEEGNLSGQIAYATVAETERYRTGAKRFWAAIVDGIVFMPFLLVERFFIGPLTNEYVIITWVIFTIFIPIIYSIYLHYKYGQTFGKWAAGIKVLDISESKTINLSQSILRDSFYLVVELFGFLYFLFMVIKTGETPYLVSEFNDFAGTPVLIWTLLELITMLTNSKRRAIHDFLAKSVVVRTE